VRRLACIGALALVAALALSGSAHAMERFPPPDFESGHVVPEGNPTVYPPTLHVYFDVGVLVALLSLTTYLALSRRSRTGIFLVMISSLFYFGFWRGGCVCSIGAIQNVTLALFDSTYAIPTAVLLTFMLPLLFALAFGRVYCAGVCPLGAIQDLFLLRPVRLPRWVEHSLGVVPYAYLALAVVLAATGSAFVICMYDPFVGFFRLSAHVGMLVFGGAFLVAGIFIGRPYCRFLCPYGALLRPLSRVSKWHVSITPDECIRCKLCDDACPFEAINPSNKDQPVRPRSLGLSRLGWLFALAPVLVLIGVAVGGMLAGPLSSYDYTIRLAERVRLEADGLVDGTTDESDAFRRTGASDKDLYADAGVRFGRLTTGARIWGGFIGFVIGAKLISLSVRRKREDYEPDKSKCVSCARCFNSCPREHRRVKELSGATGDG
jgi:NosR/NirI family nitrous oxide reductase transcriptional regulator